MVVAVVEEKGEVVEGARVDPDKRGTMESCSINLIVVRISGQTSFLDIGRVEGKAFMFVTFMERLVK